MVHPPLCLPLLFPCNNPCKPQPAWAVYSQQLMLIKSCAVTALGRQATWNELGLPSSQRYSSWLHFSHVLFNLSGPVVGKEKHIHWTHFSPTLLVGER